MSARVPEPCDVPSGEHVEPVRFFTTGWRCSAHRPGRSIPPPPARYQPSKLTPLQRDEIRRRAADGETVLALAAEFGVSVRTIRNHT